MFLAFFLFSCVFLLFSSSSPGGARARFSLFHAKIALFEVSAPSLVISGASHVILGGARGRFERFRAFRGVRPQPRYFRRQPCYSRGGARAFLAFPRFFGVFGRSGPGNSMAAAGNNEAAYGQSGHLVFSVVYAVFLGCPRGCGGALGWIWT